MAEGQSGKAKKRLVKNPETFRERAIKAAEIGDQEKRLTKVKKAAGKAAKPVYSPIDRFFSRLFGLKVFRPVAKVLRFIGKIIFPAYFRNSWRELRQVTWPTWKQSRQLTFAVLVFAIIFGAAIAAVDYGIDKIFKRILLN